MENIQSTHTYVYTNFLDPNEVAHIELPHLVLHCFSLWSLNSLYNIA